MMPFSKILVFGDGLSDQGRFGRLTGNRYPPSPPFAEGRWTNGPTWVEVFSRESGIPLAAEDNYAQGGATTGPYNVNEPLRQALGLGADAPIRGLWTQVEAAVTSRARLDPPALHVLWAGGHDIGAYLDYGQPDLVAYPPAENVRRAVEALAEAGATRFLIGNMPDMGATPAYYGTPKASEATALVNQYNRGLAMVAADLRRGRGLDVIEFDGAGAFAEIAANASSYGIRFLGESFLPMDYIDFTNPLAPAKPLPASRRTADPDEYFSFWAVSAGRRVHQLLGERAARAVRAHVAARGG